MQESRITDDGNYLFLLLGGHDFGHAGCHTDRCTHTNTGVHRRERRHEAERIAAYIAGYICFKLIKCVKDSAVRTSGTHVGWAPGQFVGRNASRLRQTKRGPEAARCQFAAERDDLLADRGNPHSLDLIFNKGIKLLDDIEFFNRGGKFTDQIVRKGVYHAEFEGRYMRQDFTDILITDAGGYDADLRIAY